MTAEALKRPQSHTQERLLVRPRGCQGRQLRLPLQIEIRSLLIYMNGGVEVQMIRRQRYLARPRDQAVVGHRPTVVVGTA